MAGQEPRGDASKFKLPADAVLKQEIPLQRRMASCVIGIKGQSVAKLRRESGAKIHVRPGQGPGELDQVVEVEGSIEAVSDWSEVVILIVNECYYWYEYERLLGQGHVAAGA
jgi:hypothetical protein